MIMAYGAFAMIPRAVFMPPAVWASVSGVQELEAVVRDSGVLIGVFEPTYLSNPCFPIIIIF